MAYTQKPGRGNSPKTGNGIPQVFNQSPMKQSKFDSTDDYLGKMAKAKDIQKGHKSVSKMNDFQQLVDRAALADSLSAANPKDSHLYTMKERESMGNKAANKTRILNNAETIVEKKEVYDPKSGYKNQYTRVKR